MSSGAHIPVRPEFFMSGAPLSIRQKPAKAHARKLLGRAVVKSTAWLRRLLSFATWSVPLSYFVQFCIGGGLFRAEAFQFLRVSGFMHAVVTPGMKLAEALFAAHMIYKGWNFLYLIVAVAALIIRHYIMTPFWRLEDWVKTKFGPSPKKKKPSLGVRLQLPTAPTAPRQ